MTPDRVNLVDKDDARSGFLALLEHVANARDTHADKHFNEIRPTDRKERDICFSRDGARQECLASAGRPDQKNPLRNAAAELLEFLGITQELDELLHFILRFLDAGDIAKCDLVLVPGKHARFRFPAIEGAYTRHADLLAEQEVKHEQEQGDGEETDHSLRKHI